jgi:hypothetical protein
MWRLIHSIKTALRFRDYKPQPLSLLSGRRWIRQFDKKDRDLAEQLLDNIIYLSEANTRKILVDQNAALMRRLLAAGLSPKQFIYVQVHDAGSSSPVMLNLLRDAAGLERMGCKFMDSRDSLRLNRTMNDIGEGALIYVDDFVGTGNQFCAERDFAAESFVGTFSEFLVAPSICEEAFYKIAERGIEAFAGHVHSKAERPLHANSTIFDPDEKDRMKLVCKGVNSRFGLGYRELATMVVLYRNAPNTVPAVLRGSLNQTPFVGIFPRTTDLPIPKLQRP